MSFVFADADDVVAMFARSADVRDGSGAGTPSTLSHSVVIVLRSWGFKSSKKSLIPERSNRQKVTYMTFV